MRLQTGDYFTNYKYCLTPTVCTSKMADVVLMVDRGQQTVRLVCTAVVPCCPRPRLTHPALPVVVVERWFSPETASLGWA